MQLSQHWRCKIPIACSERVVSDHPWQHKFLRNRSHFPEDKVRDISLQRYNPFHGYELEN